LDQVAALATNKLRSELDLRFAQVTYEEGQLLVAQAENDLEQAFNSLSTLLGDREKHVYRLIEESMSTTDLVNLTGLVDTALSQRPDLARLRLERDAASQYARAQKALNYPTVSAFGAGGFIPVRDAAHFDDRYAAAGVNLSLPIFDGGLNSAKRAEAELRSQAAGEKLRDAENTVIHDVRNASLNVNYAYEKLDLTQKLFDNASQAFELAQARYKLGSSSIVELSQAQLNKTEADIAHTSSKYEYEIQRAVLNFEIGTTQSAVITTVTRTASRRLHLNRVDFPGPHAPGHRHRPAAYRAVKGEFGVAFAGIERGLEVFATVWAGDCQKHVHYLKIL
jgi:outer membrane protein